MENSKELITMCSTCKIRSKYNTVKMIYCEECKIPKCIHILKNFQKSQIVKQFNCPEGNFEYVGYLCFECFDFIKNMNENKVMAIFHIAIEDVE